MDLDEDEDDNNARAEVRVLVGGEGGDFVAQTLSTAEDVGEAITRVQESSALSADASEVEPLLGLLGQLGMTRAEVYRSVLDDALAQLAERIKVMPQGTLLSLLDASFRYVTIEELRAVPLAVLERLKPVPSSYLKQISRDVELFRRLPVEVQRQCWELKGMLLRRHATPCLLAYGEETATTMRNLDLDLVLSPLNREQGRCVYPPGAALPGSEPHGASRAVPGLPRRSLRRASASVQRLRRMVGDSKRLYLVRRRVVPSALRRTRRRRRLFPPLAAPHGTPRRREDGPVRVGQSAQAGVARGRVRAGPVPGRPPRGGDVRHRQAARFRLQGGRAGGGQGETRGGGQGGEERDALWGGAGTAATRGGTRSKGLAPLKVTFGLGKKKAEKDAERAADDDAAVQPESERVAAPVRSVGGEAGNDTSERGDSDGDAPAGSMSRAANASDAANENLLGDVGMILRDPPVLSLLLHETVRTLEGVVEAARVPKSEPRLAELTRFLALACGARVNCSATASRRRPSIEAAGVTVVPHPRRAPPRVLAPRQRRRGRGPGPGSGYRDGDGRGDGRRRRRSIGGGSGFGRVPVPLARARALARSAHVDERGDPQGGADVRPSAITRGRRARRATRVRGGGGGEDFPRRRRRRRSR